MGGFPGGCGSSPLPTPLLPLGADGAPDCAMADELIVVDSSRVMLGGTTAANFPALTRNALRSFPVREICFDHS